MEELPPEGLRFRKPRKLRRRGELTRYYYCRCYDPVTRTTTEVSTGCSDRRAAEAWRRTKERQSVLSPEERTVRAREPVSFKAAQKAWLEDLKARTSEGYFAVRKTVVDAFWHFFHSCRLEDVDGDLIHAYLVRRKKGKLKKKGKRKKKQGPVSAWTVNGDRQLLQTFFIWCIRRGLCEKNPVAATKRFSGEMRRRVRYLSEDDQETLLEKCKRAPKVKLSAVRNAGGPKGGKSTEEKSQWEQSVPVPGYLYPLVTVALFCGFRRRTILSVKWRHADLENCRWRIPGELMKRGEDYDAPIPKRVVQTLKEFRKKLEKLCLRKGINPVERLGSEAPIFGLKPSSSLKRSFQSAVKRAGLDGLTFHDLRGIYLNRLRELGVPLETAMRLTDHRDIGVVLRHYRQVQQVDLENAVALLDGKAPRKRKTKGR